MMLPLIGSWMDNSGSGSEGGPGRGLEIIIVVHQSHLAIGGNPGGRAGSGAIPIPGMSTAIVWFRFLHSNGWIPFNLCQKGLEIIIVMALISPFIFR